MHSIQSGDKGSCSHRGAGILFKLESILLSVICPDTYLIVVTLAKAIFHQPDSVLCKASEFKSRSQFQRDGMKLCVPDKHLNLAVHEPCVCVRERERERESVTVTSGYSAVQ